ncbi:MAG: N-acetyl-gamma-glutamyl-phosphate reductase [Clostridia bacterium]|nr:N-acetyl-gamma-glutamyl-phosphate reductase [Clostridia bacterium]
MKKVFIDGGAGTTGLRIKNRLSARDDLEIITLPDDKRKDIEYRKECLNTSDVSILCLPDDAAKQAVSLVENPDTVIIDTSTAHRTDDDFAYGFPEIFDYRNKIKTATRIANPGCHATGFTTLIAPLIENGMLFPDARLTCFSITGYSGGGKKMIAQYESENRQTNLDSPGLYGLTQSHKHLPEMVKHCKLKEIPVFCPVVAPYYSGMQVTVPLFKSDINYSLSDIKELYISYYASSLIKFSKSEDNTLYAGCFSGFDDMQITVEGNEDRILLISRFDNLGKGASGAAIQNLNICLGIEEYKGLIFKERTL